MSCRLTCGGGNGASVCEAEREIGEEEMGEEGGERFDTSKQC